MGFFSLTDRLQTASRFLQTTCYSAANIKLIFTNDLTFEIKARRGTSVNNNFPPRLFSNRCFILQPVANLLILIWFG